MCVSFDGEGSVAMAIVVHVDDIFAVGRREPCDLSARDLNRSRT